MANRTITYGYKIENGILSIEPHEALVVKEVFTSYVNGTILNDIAKKLTQRCEIYFCEKAVWSKNMIDRIISNRRYLGSGEYPAIIDTELFDKANALKTSKGKVSAIIPEELRALADKTVCAECGGRYYRKPSWGAREKWICRNGCKTDIYVSDKEFVQGISDALVKAKENTSLLRIGEAKETFIPTLGIIRRTKEIGQMSEQLCIGFETVSKAILECANAKFLCCREDTARTYNDYVIQAVESLENTEIINSDFTARIITSIFIHKDGGVTVSLINGAKIKGRSR